MFKGTFLILICITIILKTYSQKTTIKTIISDNTSDSSLINAEHLSFDKNGNYVFHVKKDDRTFFITNSDTIGPLKNTNRRYSSTGNVTYGYGEQGLLYYFNSLNTRIFGPVKGKMKDAYTNDSYDYVIISVLDGDSLYYYANGALITVRHATKEGHPTRLNSWVTFSSNDKIYVDKQKDIYRIVAGDKVVAESKNSLSQPAMNDKGDYLYVEGMKPPPGSRYDIYQFYIHTKDTSFGPVRTVWSYKLNNDGSWYYTSDDAGPEYIVINDRMYRDIDNIKDIILLDKTNYFFTYTRNDRQYYNHNGIEYEDQFKDKRELKIDKNGRLSFYTIKDYYLYKVLNGKMQPEPITNYGVRPWTIYLSTSGVSYHCFITDDSMYLYKDNTLVFEPAPLSKGFETRNLAGELPENRRNYSGRFEYFKWGDSGYIIFNDQLSHGMMAYVEKGGSLKEEPGEIVGGEIGETVFYLIQKTGEGKYVINVNNKVYKEIENITKIIRDFSFLNNNKLVFYVLQGKDFLQYTIEF